MTTLDREEVARALALDRKWAEQLRGAWLHVMELAVFGDLKAQRLGALPRLRKKTLDCGEKLRATLADREWIPQPRERLKNALASALALQEALVELDAGARELDAGADRAAFGAAVAALRATALAELRPRANGWAALLDQRREADDNPAV